MRTEKDFPRIEFDTAPAWEWSVLACTPVVLCAISLFLICVFLFLRIVRGKAYRSIPRALEKLSKSSVVVATASFVCHLIRVGEDYFVNHTNSFETYFSRILCAAIPYYIVALFFAVMFLYVAKGLGKA
jgi:hypothetical protein